MRTQNVISRYNHLRPFGRKGLALAIAADRRSALAEDLKLFAFTFAAGFLFVSLYLA